MCITELVYIKHQKNKFSSSIRPLTIPYYELTVVFKGQLDYLIDGQRIQLREGDAIFVPPGAVRQRKRSEVEADYISFNFRTDTPIVLPAFLPNILTGEIRLLLAAADEILNTHISAFAEPISHLLLCLLSTIKNNLVRQSAHPLVVKIIRYLHENIAEKITLSDVAQNTFFSAVYCDSVFKKEMGRSIIDYLLEERIALAKQLLHEGTLSLRQIAEAVGFPDYNYFARTFKKRTGYPPGQYQKTVCLPPA